MRLAVGSQMSQLSQSDSNVYFLRRNARSQLESVYFDLCVSCQHSVATMGGRSFDILHRRTLFSSVLQKVFSHFWKRLQIVSCVFYACLTLSNISVSTFVKKNPRSTTVLCKYNSSDFSDLSAVLAQSSAVDFWVRALFCQDLRELSVESRGGTPRKIG